MTKIELSYKDRELKLHVEGHAERSSDEDVNLCCAGVSMIVQTAIATFQQYAEIDFIEEIHIESRLGESKLYAKAYAWTEDRCSGICDMLEAGFGLLKERYPDKILWGEIEN